MEFYFNKIASQYDATRGMPPGVDERICAWVLARLPADPTITEIGVGTGRIALPFILRNVRFTGFDIAEGMLDIARAKLSGDLRRATLALADITDELPLPSGSQDAIIAVHILHLVDAEKAMRQVHRVLKPHGALIWGYQWHGDLSARKLIRERFYEETVALGAPPPSNFLVPSAQRLLHELGARATRHTVATWVELESPEAVLQGIRSRSISATWSYGEELFREAMRRTEAWAAVQFGDLARPHELEERFVVDWYQF